VLCSSSHSLSIQGLLHHVTQDCYVVVGAVAAGCSAGPAMGVHRG
jgi:hypothetical protein